MMCMSLFCGLLVLPLLLLLPLFESRCSQFVSNTGCKQRIHVLAAAAAAMALEMVMWLSRTRWQGPTF